MRALLAFEMHIWLAGFYVVMRKRRMLAFAGVLFLAAAFVVGVQGRVVTYVCGNDPMLYQRAARVILQPGLYGWGAWRVALTFVAPGYPLLLAGVIGVFWDLAPYWSNMVFLLLALPLMWFVFRRLSGGERPAALMLLCWLWIVFSGHPLHAPFLLYPFREVPRMLLVYVAYALLLHGVNGQAIRRWLFVCAGLAMLAACGIREPSVFVLPGLLVGVASLTNSWRRRLAAWGWVLLPWVFCAVPAVLMVSRMQLVDISQFSVMPYLRNHHVALIRARQMLPWFPERMTWLGLLLIVIGVVRSSVRARTMLGWFLIPATLFFVFYAYMQRHDRYFLTTIVFLAVFAGYGLDWLLSVVETTIKSIASLGTYESSETSPTEDCCFLDSLRRPEVVAPLCRPVGSVRWTFFLRHVISLVACLLILGAMTQTVRSVGVWGPSIRAREARKWQAVVAGLEPSADGRVRVAVEQRCRYLEDMLMAYTDAELLDPKAIDSWPDQWSPAHYFQPLNREAEYATPQWLMYLKVYAHRIMEHRMNVTPSGNEDVFLGRGRYRHQIVSTWEPGEYEQQVEMVAEGAHVLWFDWGSGADGAVKRVSVYCGESGVLLTMGEVVGNGIQAIVMPGGRRLSGRVRIMVSAEVPIPSAPVVAVLPMDTPIPFALGVDRMLSSNLILRNRKDHDQEPHFLHWRSNSSMTMVMPGVRSAANVNLLVSLSGNGDIAEDAYLVGHRESGSAFVRRAAELRGGMTFVARPGEQVVLTIAGNHLPATQVGVSIEQIRFAVTEKEYN
jgi:hypothetical protein